MTVGVSSAPRSGRARIMAAALDLFSKHGTSVGVDRVIAQAGVAKATFYRHFPSKEDLVVAFLADRELLSYGHLVADIVTNLPAPSVNGI